METSTVTRGAVQPLRHSRNWPSLLDNGSEMGRRILAFDWSGTSLGPIETWPQSLRSLLGVLISSRSPLFLWWGKEFLQFYNDAYRPIMGSALHPSGLGQRGPECWGEAWTLVYPLVEAAMERGEASSIENGRLPLERNGYVEETYFDYSLTPVRDESGEVAGIFCAVTETTQRVIGERRILALRDVGTRSLEARDPEEACRMAAAALGGYPEDVPFAFIYLADAEKTCLRLAGQVGGCHPAAPPEAALAGREPLVFPLREVVRTGVAEVVGNLPEGLGTAGRPWPESARAALVLPLGEPSRRSFTGVAVFGISPRRPLDDEYRGFLELLAGQLAATVQRAHAYELELARVRREAGRLQREQAEERVRHSERWLSLALESGQMGVWDLDLVHDTSERSLQHDQIFGYDTPVRDWGQVTFLGHVLEEDRESVKAKFREALETDSLVFECRILRKDGVVRWIAARGRVYRDASGRPVRMMGTVMDSTARKQVEQEYQKFMSLVENSTDFIGIASLEGEIQYLNPAGRRLIGIAQDEDLRRLPLLDLFTEEFHRSMKDVALPTVFETGHWEGEVQLRQAGSGHRIDVQQTLFQVRHAHSCAPFCLAIIAHDVTGRRRTERALEKAEEQLRQSQKMESIGKLAGGIAHDFNNLLTAINGYSDMSLAMMEAAHPVRGNLEEIRNAGERAATLTRQLLAFSRKQMLSSRAVNLNAVVREMDKLLQRLIGEDIRVETRLEKDLGWVKADTGQLEQVILNLVVNSRDAMPKGGVIRIETANVVVEGMGEVPEAFLPPGAYVQLMVQDEGTGMTQDVKERMFEPFFTTKEVGKGTGLGLSMVYGTVTQSHGHIVVDSKVGEGTAFRIYLPQCEPGEEEAAVPARKTRKSAGARETILLVEDEDTVRRLAKQVLEQSGYRVLEAADGLQGLKSFEGLPDQIDLLVTDVVMPRMSGRELAERIKASQPGIRVLFMSGYTSDAHILQGITLSRVGFLQKPFLPNMLVESVRDALEAVY